MGTRNIRVSDLTGRQFAAGDEPVRLVVLEHPDLTGPPVQLEVLLPEITPAVDAALSVAVVEVHVLGEDPRRIVVDAGDFDALASDTPMVELLKTAPAVKGAKASKGARSALGTSIDYASIAHAGRPHPGRVTEAEARVVREHLAMVNARLAGEGQRQIDPSNPTDAERYGFGASAAAPDTA